MVVALLDNDTATLKKFYRERDHIRLEPANPELEPIIVKDQPFKIQGIVIGLLRKYI
jgi:repressor LexA